MKVSNWQYLKPCEGKPASEQGFKVGDNFVVLDSSHWFEQGEVVTLVRNDGSNCPYFTNGNDGWSKYMGNLAPYKIMKYEVGQVLERRNYTYKVLAVCGLVCLLSNFSRHELTDDWYTQERLDQLGFRLKTDPDPVEITADEAIDAYAKSKGLDADKVRIKKS